MSELPIPTPFAKRRPRLNSLTSLRFFAALLIFILHSKDHGLIPLSFLESFDLSKSVSFFFVLSGFVLTYSYHRRHYSIPRFYCHRFARIWPITFFLLLSILIFLPQSLFLPVNSSFPSFFLILLSHIFLLQSIIPIPEVYFGFNAVAWSISVEVFFYILFPAFNSLRTSKLFLRSSFLSVLLLLFSFCIQLFAFPEFSPHHLDSIVWEGFTYINPLFRLPEFIFGILAARLFMHVSTSSFQFPFSVPSKICGRAFFEIFVLLGSLYLGFSPIASPPSYPYQQYISQIFSASYFAIAIYISASSRSFIMYLLNIPILIVLGEVSFGFYLIHQPLLIIAAQGGGFWFLGYNLLPNSLAVLFPLSIVLASLSYYLVEKPAQKYIKMGYDSLAGV